MLWMRIRKPFYSVFSSVIYTLVTHVRLVSQAEIDTYLTCRSYCMVCASVREDNPRALARGLSPIQKQNHSLTCLLHQHANLLCALRGNGISMKCAILVIKRVELQIRIDAMYILACL